MFRILPIFYYIAALKRIVVSRHLVTVRSPNSGYRGLALRLQLQYFHCYKQLVYRTAPSNLSG